MNSIPSRRKRNDRIPEEAGDLQDCSCSRPVLRNNPDYALGVGLAPDDAKVLFQPRVARIVAAGRDDQDAGIAYTLDDCCGGYADLGVESAAGDVRANADRD